MTWVRSGMAIYGLGYEMVWDESAWVRNDLIPFRLADKQLAADQLMRGSGVKLVGYWILGYSYSNIQYPTNWDIRYSNNLCKKKPLNFDLRYLYIYYLYVTFKMIIY